MTCAFDLDHYRELLAAARAGGYRYAHFDQPPRRSDLLLRHDVDLSLDAALRMAALEAEEGASATYFLMTESVFYNLASSEGVAAIGELLPARPPRGAPRRLPEGDARRALRSRRRLAQPDPEYMTHPIDGAVNVMQEGLFDPPTYRSDSNQRWRSGCPHEELRAAGFPWLQLLVHPEIWAYPARRWDRRCARCSTPSGSDASRSSRTTASTSDERDPARRRQTSCGDLGCVRGEQLDEASPWSGRTTVNAPSVERDHREGAETLRERDERCARSSRSRSSAYCSRSSPIRSQSSCGGAATSIDSKPRRNRASASEPS